MRHRVVSEAKMRNAPIFVSAVLAALSITQASTITELKEPRPYGLGLLP